VTARQADVVSAQLDSQTYTGVGKYLGCHRMHCVAVGVRLKLRLTFPEGCDNIYKMETSR
jgi:hypothetical protein